MDRAVCLIDGFNLYHAIDRLNNDALKWCDYRQLALHFLKPERHQLLDVIYFTALANHKPDGLNRHKLFIEALESKKVEVVLGNFKKVSRHCKNCGQKYTAHEEKRTDVNLAVRLLDLAHKDLFDTAIIISSDSDYVSALELVRKNFPKKTIGIVFPVGQRHSDELASVATFFRYMKTSHLQKSLLPEKVTLQDQTFIIRPKKYNPIVPKV